MEDVDEDDISDCIHGGLSERDDRVMQRGNLLLFNTADMRLGSCSPKSVRRNVPSTKMNVQWHR